MVLQATQDIGHSTAIVAYANDIEAAENLKEQLLAVDGIEQVLIMPLDQSSLPTSDQIPWLSLRLVKKLDRNSVR